MILFIVQVVIAAWLFLGIVGGAFEACWKHGQIYVIKNVKQVAIVGLIRLFVAFVVLNWPVVLGGEGLKFTGWALVYYIIDILANLVYMTWTTRETKHDGFSSTIAFGLILASMIAGNIFWPLKSLLGILWPELI